MRRDYSDGADYITVTVDMPLYRPALVPMSKPVDFILRGHGVGLPYSSHKKLILQHIG